MHSVAQHTTEIHTQHDDVVALLEAAAVAGPAGALAAPAALVDTSTVSPGYYVKSPYSYSQTFVIPAVDPAATSVTLSINYEMLLQTSKNSKSYSKQTASDTLTVAIAQPPAED